MKENNKSSILISVLCGVAVCFACLGIVFLLPAKNTNNLEGNNSLTNPNEGEVNLGDTCEYGCASGQYVTTCTGIQNTSGCFAACFSTTGAGDCSSRGGTFVGAQCCFGNAEHNEWVCNTCNDPPATDPPAPTPTPTGCGAGQGADSSASSGCSNCSAGYYSPANDNTCHPCPSGQTSGVGASSCTPVQTTGCGAGQGADSSASSGCSNCSAGYYSPANDDTCHPCPSGQTSGVGASSCTPVQTTITCWYVSDNMCKSGKYQARGCGGAGYGLYENYSDCLNHIPKVTCWHENSDRTNCVSMKTTTCDNDPELFETQEECRSSLGLSPKVPCVSLPSTEECLKRDDCRWDYTNYCHSVSVNPKKLYVHGGGVAYVTPNECKTFTFTAVDENSKLISASWSVSGGGNHVSHNCSTGSYCRVTVCGYTCDSYSVTATAAYNGLSGSGSASVTAYQEWREVDWNKKADSEPYIYNTSALDNPTCVAYSNPHTENGVTIYEKKYYRCCGSGGSGGNETPAPEIPKVQKVPRCYFDEDNNYHWTADPESSWVIATDDDGSEITNKKLCPPKEACYQNPDGEYEWGEFSAKPGYVYHAEITDKDSCKEDPGAACYRKDNDFVWTATPPEGYEKVNVTYEQCENPACYYVESKRQRVWGYYSKVNGYYRIVDDNDNDIPYNQCINEACYKCSGNEYKWGDYSNNDDCEVLPSVTDINQCNNEVPTPPTGVSVSTIIYVFMAILMAFGLGFIYYSTMLKKNN